MKIATATAPMNADFHKTRNWLAALSGLGAANMAVVSMRQLGILSHLPDPPVTGFDSNAVVLSPAAFTFGAPDGPIALAGMLSNIPMTRVGGPHRTRNHPWIPIVIAAKAVVEVSVAAWYLVQMRTRVHAWCAYCLAGFALSSVIALLALEEARSALHTPRARLAGAVGMAVVAGLTVGAMCLLDARQRGTRTAGPRSSGSERLSRGFNER